MSKKKSKGNSQTTKYGHNVSPEFKRHIEEMSENVIDFSDAPAFV